MGKPEFIRRATAHALRIFVRNVPPKRRGNRVITLVEQHIPPPRQLMRARHISGYLVTCDLTDVVQKSMYYRGTFEPTASQIIWDALPEGGTFLDVGANAGHYTFLAAAKVGPAGRVHAIEAAPLTAHRLHADLKANGLIGRVVVHEVAVADQPGEMRLQHAPGPARYAMRYLDPDAAVGGEVVVVTTVDELLPELRADVVKIDVEGADLRVLRGMAKVLESHQPKLLIVEAIDTQLARFGDSRAALVAFMRQAGYTQQEFTDETEAGTLAFVPARFGRARTANSG